jgi:predicted P-loop ATPase
MEDADDFYVLTWLQRHAAGGRMVSLSATKANTAAMFLANEASFNPVRDYLDSVAWDGTKRLSNWLEHYALVETATAQDVAYIRGVARKWMISAVARVFDPGCKADHVLILQGPQGIGKSSALRILAGKWFAEDLPNVAFKDAQQYLGDCWIIEMSELASTRGAAVESVKAFMTRQVDKYRIPYGKKMTNQKRRCVFAATTNAEAYLLDPTGNRRYWPVKVGRIDLAGLKKDRDQLWAEAVVAYRAGEKWHFDRDLDVDAALGALEAQEAVYIQNPDEEKVRDWLRGQENRVTMNKIVNGVFREHHEHKRSIEKRLVHALTEMLPRLGWHKDTTVRGIRTYARGPEAEPYVENRSSPA